MEKCRYSINIMDNYTNDEILHIRDDFIDFLRKRNYKESMFITGYFDRYVQSFLTGVSGQN